MRWRALTPVLLLVAAAVSATPAAAGIFFCNKFPETVYVAIAYPQDTGIWMSRGWFEVASGQCGPFDTALSTKTFYYRAESEEYRYNGKRVTMSWGDKGDRSFAIWEDANFQYYEAEHRVLKSTLKGFEKGLDGADEYDVTVTLHPDSGATELRVPKKH